MARLADGDREGAHAVLQVLTDPLYHGFREYGAAVPGLVRCALALDDVHLARALCVSAQPEVPATHHALSTGAALIEQASGHHTAAAEALSDGARAWGRFGNRLEEAYTLLDLARSAREVGGPAHRIAAEAKA